MLGALDTRDAGVDNGLELTGVQVPPAAFRGVVVAGQFLLALRTRSEAAIDVLNLNVDLRRLDVDLHVNNPPGGCEPRDVLVKLGVEHGAALQRGRKASSLYGLPTPIGVDST